MRDFQTINRIAVKLRPAAEKQVLRKHPWVFSESIDQVKGNPKTGDLAIIFGKKKNSLIGIGLFDLKSPIRIKMVSFKPAKLDEEWFKSRINEAYEKRTSLISEATNSFRLLFGEADGLPGVICDVYNGNAVVKIYSGCWLPFLELLVECISSCIKTKCVILRYSRNVLKEYPALKEGQVVNGILESEEVTFKEYDVLFKSNLISGHKTGFFLDHRNNRKLVGEMSKGLKVLDVFSYAGGFSVHSLCGGAKEVMSVDISSPALELAKRNAKLNSYSGVHRIKVGDAFEILENFIENGILFDLVIIDPPSFAKQKSEITKALNQYYRLAQLGSQLVSKNGHLILASCSSRVLKDEFENICISALSDSGSDFRLKKITGHDIDHPVIPEFPEGNYLKCCYFKKNS